MQVSSLLACITLLIVVALSGCASIPHNPPEPKKMHLLIATAKFPNNTASTKATSSKSTKTNKIFPLNLTPLTAFYDGDKNENSGTAYANNYTRLLIESDVGAMSDRTNAIPYDYESRSAISRYFWGEDLGINLSLKIVVGQYENTVSLLSLSRESDSNGEYWSRTIYHNAYAFPWFLVKKDGESSVPVFIATLRGTQTYKSRMAATALQISVSAIQNLSPASTLLTKLNAPSEKTRSNAIDGAISKLFSDGITEQHITERDLKYWHCHGNGGGKTTSQGGSDKTGHCHGGVGVTLEIPQYESQDNWNDNLHPVGTWIITFENPRPSIFYDAYIANANNCKTSSETEAAKDSKFSDNQLCFTDRKTALMAVHQHIDASSILSFRLFDPVSSTAKDLGTIESYISQQPWFLTALTSFKNKIPNDKYIAENLCRRIDNAMISMGLNWDDAAMVIWALKTGGPIPSNMNDKAYDEAPTCAAATSPIDGDRKN